MARRQLLIEIPALGVLDREKGNLAKQLAAALRDAISKGQLQAGERLPSTRLLASSLGVSRGTVSEAYDQLIAEGSLEARPGSGTQVAMTFDEQLVGSKPLARETSRSAPPLPTPAKRFIELANKLSPLPSVPFSVAVPEGAVAMDDHWRRLSNRVRSSSIAAPASYSDPRGLPALRTEIAEYLRRSRGVSCGLENVVVTEGTQQGLYPYGHSVEVVLRC